jgi:hypothetical protein
MFKTTLFYCFFTFLSVAQIKDNGLYKYTFNNGKKAVFYKGYVNTFKLKEGIPLNFDGALRIHTTDILSVYRVEVLDTVTSLSGKLNITAYIEAPEGGREKVFIDKFPFEIKEAPSLHVFIGNSVSGENIDTSNLRLKVGFIEPFPISNYKVSEVSLIIEKREVITLNSEDLSQSVKRKLSRLSPGAEVRVSVTVKDPLNKTKRINGVFFIEP